MLVIDGSEGEGGGQVLRTSLCLSLITNTPFTLRKIRGRRPKPGLMRQHLTCVLAAQAVGGAQVKGAHLGSQELEFHPTALKPGIYSFDVGSAGSACLVLQTVLPALLTAPGPSTITVQGGTHNSMSPPFDFLAHCYSPLVRRLGAGLDIKLDSPGFYPAGGGSITATISPVAVLLPLNLLERGSVLSTSAKVWLSMLPVEVAQQELGVVRGELGWDQKACHIESVTQPRGPGNVLVLEVETEQITGVFTAFGERGSQPIQCARRAVTDVKNWLTAGVPVDEHLADQLVLLLALAGEGSFTTARPSLHATTNADIIQKFLKVSVCFEEISDLVWRVGVTTSFQG